MNELTQDLDNNLFANDAYSGFTKMAALAPTENKPIGYVTAPPPRGSNSLAPENGNGQVVSPALVETPIQENLGNDDGMTTEPVPNEEGSFEDGGMMGGGMMGGGGGGMPPEEEVIVEEGMMRVEDDKILGLKPVYFWSLLAVAAAGGIWYYRKKIKK